MLLLFLAKQLARNDEALNFAGTFANRAELRISIELLGRVVLDETVAAVHLHAFVGHAHGDFTGEKLGHTRFTREADIFLISEPGGLINKQARSFNLSGHVGKLELNGLKLADGLAELLALFRIASGGFQRAL